MEIKLKKFVVKSLAEYVEIATSIASENEEVWFRGHESASFRLEPSALRYTVPLTDGRGNPVKQGQIIRSEGGEVTGISVERMFDEFKDKAVPFLKREPRNDFEWMFLMQHYGVPTRLLDWTTNSLVALYFAIQTCPTSNEERLYEETDAENFLNDDEFNSYGAAVFALDPIKLNEKTISYKGKVRASSEPDKWDHYVDPMNKDGLNFFPIAIQSSHIDARIRSQSGHFTLHGVNIQSIDYITELRKILYKIYIPYGVVPKMLNELHALGVTDSFIFPDLDGVSKEVKRKEVARFSRSGT